MYKLATTVTDVTPRFFNLGAKLAPWEKRYGYALFTNQMNWTLWSSVVERERPLPILHYIPLYSRKNHVALLI